MVRAKWGQSVISRLSCSEPKLELETKACFPLLKGYPDRWLGKCWCYSPTVFSYLWVLKSLPPCYLPQDNTLVWLQHSMQTKVLLYSFLMGTMKSRTVKYVGHGLRDSSLWGTYMRDSSLSVQTAFCLMKLVVWTSSSRSSGCGLWTSKLMLSKYMLQMLIPAPLGVSCIRIIAQLSHIPWIELSNITIFLVVLISGNICLWRVYVYWTQHKNFSIHQKSIWQHPASLANSNRTMCKISESIAKLFYLLCAVTRHSQSWLACQSGTVIGSRLTVYISWDEALIAPCRMRSKAEWASAEANVGVLVIKVGKLFKADSMILHFPIHWTPAVSHKL